MSNEIILAIIGSITTSGILTSLGLYFINRQKNNHESRNTTFLSLSQKYDILFAELAADKKETKKKLERVEEKYDRLIDKYDVLDRKYDDLEKKYNALLKEHERVVKDNKDKQNQITVLQGKVKQLEKDNETKG